MIRYLLLQNRAGKTRLAKYYIPLDDADKHALEYEVHKLIANRDPKFTNFVEVSRVAAGLLDSCCCAHTPHQRFITLPLCVVCHPSKVLYSACQCMNKPAHHAAAVAPRSSRRTRWCTGATRGCSSQCAST